MTATRPEPTAAQPGAPQQPRGLPTSSLPESIAILLTGVVPALVRGLFSPRRRAMKLLTALDADRRTVALLSKARRRHDGEGLRLLGGRLVLLWGANAIREVLDQSADTFASDAGAKAKGMSHFQPDALTLSRGEEWKDRRAFNEQVLAAGQRVHPSAQRFLAVIAEEVDRLPQSGALTWDDWERVFDHVTLRVIFGDRSRGEQRLTQTLEKLMGEANRLVGLRPNEAYYDLYGLLERQLTDPEPDTLIARFNEAPQTVNTRIVQQIPHWMFATRDTLAANAYRALVAIAADPDVERRVREELAGADLSDPNSVDGLRYLEGCLHEAMRLWPTTPLLARETTRETTLGGERLEAGTQVILLNVFNHRDPEHVEQADRLDPERWTKNEPDYRFNHLSNGTQDCPGGPLVLLLGKAAIARVLDRNELSLERPSLAPGGSLPHMLDFFDACFTIRPRGQP